MEEDGELMAGGFDEDGPAFDELVEGAQGDPAHGGIVNRQGRQERQARSFLGALGV
jgi:hypothetical protein